MLELDVDKRLTASQALAHPFFEPFRDPEEETESPQQFDDSLEHEKLTVDEWKRKSWGPRGSGLSLLCPLCSQAWPQLARALRDPHCRLLSEQILSPACIACSLSRLLLRVMSGEGALFLPQHPLHTSSQPVFRRAPLQGDRELQPHCPEGLTAPERHEAAVTRLAGPLAEPRACPMAPPAGYCP